MPACEAILGDKTYADDTDRLLSFDQGGERDAYGVGTYAAVGIKEKNVIRLQVSGSLVCSLGKPKVFSVT